VKSPIGQRSLAKEGEMVQRWEEKRRYPRFQVNCPISFICFDKLRIGETADISIGGMKIQSRYLLFAGETYDFTVVMNGRAISPKGKVVYLENQPEYSYGAGVSFVNISEDHQSQLTSFLSAKSL
jgi:c-di-GMP-binding flagellar brake protein YcgR